MRRRQKQFVLALVIAAMGGGARIFLSQQTVTEAAARHMSGKQDAVKRADEHAGALKKLAVGVERRV
jgi:hypothetical protein